MKSRKNFERTIRAAWVIVALAALAIKCSAQSHFQFEASFVYLKTNDGKDDVQTRQSVGIRANADSLFIGIHNAPLLFTGVTWTRTDGGRLYCVSPAILATYCPGDKRAGRALIIVTSAYTAEFYEND